ncbi:ABC transporter substrate-binding protein [Mitsuaria sp. GD03876]|uniref:heme/hemin ABC transporter substrate-binding protein n=1 Tax=Mitsuaria sp. GD03876 TaxID=2975399 RepID=UPI002446C9E5|nr:ABC transporter substrate-binding protein [Mitsuaria sp. GD03876]MDH0863382.1 ABC transporter substrate-binding protein [Mitsuaria sp. GD03876]
MLSRRQVLSIVPAAALMGVGGRASAAPRRIISIGGALTELIYELGAQGELVGVDSTSLYPAAATKLPNVGYARTLAAEGLLSLAPTLVVATEEAGPPPVLRQLEAAKVPLHVLRSEFHFEGVLERTRRLGELLGREAQAAALAQKLQAEWAASRARVTTLAAGHRAPRVLFVLSNAANQARIAGSATGADAMIVYAGGTNALADAQGYKMLSPEAAIAAAPDVILATTQGVEASGGVDGLLKLPGLAQTPAGQQRRVLVMETMELLGFGPRAPRALATLAQGLHAPAGKTA